MSMVYSSTRTTVTATEALVFVSGVPCLRIGRETILDLRGIADVGRTSKHREQAVLMWLALCRADLAGARRLADLQRLRIVLDLSTVTSAKSRISVVLVRNGARFPLCEIDRVGRAVQFGAAIAHIIKRWTGIAVTVQSET